MAQVIGWCVQTSDCLMRLGKVRPGWFSAVRLAGRNMKEAPFRDTDGASQKLPFTQRLESTLAV
jgi:hypothetical protein